MGVINSLFASERLCGHGLTVFRKSSGRGSSNKRFLDVHYPCGRNHRQGCSGSCAADRTDGLYSRIAGIGLIDGPVARDHGDVAESPIQEIPSKEGASFRTPRAPLVCRAHTSQGYCLQCLPIFVGRCLTGKGVSCTQKGMRTSISLIRGCRIVLRP